jgi:hypothetical protein
MNKQFTSFWAVVSVLLGGCVTGNEVLFVTKTSVGVEMDSKPASVNIAYDRVEGYLGPRYENGAMPPVVAAIDTNAAVFSPETEQLYATGAAAVNILLEAEETATVVPTDLSGKKKLMFFGTTTTGGLKVGFTNNIPDSFLFGFRRKEYSLIPLGNKKTLNTQGKTELRDVYPAVFAYLKSGVQTESPADTSFRIKQYFATGEAAANLATKTEVRQLMQQKRLDAFGIYQDHVNVQRAHLVSILKCQALLPNEDLGKVIDDANRHELFYEEGTYTRLAGQFESATQLSTETREEVAAKNAKMQSVRKNYVSRISTTVEGANQEKSEAIRRHREFSCDLAMKARKAGSPANPDS